MQTIVQQLFLQPETRGVVTDTIGAPRRQVLELLHPFRQSCYASLHLGFRTPPRRQLTLTTSPRTLRMAAVSPSSAHTGSNARIGCLPQAQDLSPIPKSSRYHQQRPRRHAGSPSFLEISSSRDGLPRCQVRSHGGRDRVS